MGPQRQGVDPRSGETKLDLGFRLCKWWAHTAKVWTEIQDELS